MLKLSFALAFALLVRGCPASGQNTSRPYALRGTLVMPDTLIEDGTLLIRNGLIEASGDHVTVPPGVPVIETHAVIAPGFIDLHNHLTWNVFPRWRPAEIFNNRYDWQARQIYQTTVATPHAQLVADGFECAAERYAEVKALTEGETSVVGSLHAPCSEGLARNLDLPNRAGPTVAYDVFPLQTPEDTLAAIKPALAAKSTSALLIHLAEGSPHDAAASREFSMLKGRGLLMPGVTLIHGGGLKPNDFHEMAEHHVGLVWSPRSNIELYGDTTDIASAKAAGVSIALAPDWSITGSDGTLGELTWASLWSAAHGNLFSDADLVRMATVNAAALLGQSGALGSLKPGQIADVLVIDPGQPGEPSPKAGHPHDGWWTLTHASPAQVALVIVAGQPLYGDPALLAKVSPQVAERLELCGMSKALLFVGGHDRADDSVVSWAETVRRLDTEMQHYNRKLAPLSECGN